MYLSVNTDWRKMIQSVRFGKRYFGFPAGAGLQAKAGQATTCSASYPAAAQPALGRAMPACSPGCSSLASQPHGGKCSVGTSSSHGISAWCSACERGGEGRQRHGGLHCRDSSVRGMACLDGQTSDMLLPPSIKQMLTAWKMATHMSSLFCCWPFWDWEGNGLRSCAVGASPMSPGLGWCHLGVMVVGEEEVCVPGDPAVVGVFPGPPQDFLTQLALVCTTKCL